MRSTRRDKSSHVEKLAKTAAFVGDLGEVYKMTMQLVNANTKADPLVLDLNGNILSTDEENTLSLCLIMLSRVMFLLLLQPQKLFHQLEAYHKLRPVNRK